MKFNNFIKNYLNGKISLVIAWWVINPILTASLFFLNYFITEYAIQGKLSNNLLLFYTYVAIPLIYVLMFTATFRSASNYQLINKHKKWGGVAKFFLCIGLFKVFLAYIPHSTPSSDDLKNINEHLPRMIDRETRWDSYQIDKDGINVLTYTLINQDISNVDTQTLRNYIINQNCKSSSEIKMGKTLKLIYNSNDGREIFEVLINNNICRYIR